MVELWLGCGFDNKAKLSPASGGAWGLAEFEYICHNCSQALDYLTLLSL